MATANKTLPQLGDGQAFLASIEPEVRRTEAALVASIMQKVSGHPPVIWGKNLVGFGTYHYQYESGRQGDYFRFGFSPRKSQMTLYLTAGFDDLEPMLARLGKHSTGQSCLYIKQLSHIDVDVLEEILEASWAQMAARYPV